MKLLKLAVAVCAGLSACAAQAEDASDYPSRSISLVAPLAPGSDTDAVARMLATSMSNTIGQTIVVMNKPGAGGQIGMSAVAKSDPDGYTIGLAFQTALTLVPHLKKEVPYTPDSFATVGRLATTTNAFVVKSDAPYKSIDDFLAQAKEEPGKLTVGSWGLPTGGGVAVETLKSASGADVIHVPYKGTAEEYVGLMRGELDMAIIGGGMATVKSKAGEIRVIAITGTERVKQFPDAPMLAELDIPLSMDGWFGLVAPAGTPAAIIEKLEKALMESTEDPEIKQRLDILGMNLRPLSASDYAAQIRGEYDTWGVLAEKAGIEKN